MATAYTRKAATVALFGVAVRGVDHNLFGDVLCDRLQLAVGY